MGGCPAAACTVELLRATVKLYSKGRFAEIVFSKISDAPFEDCYPRTEAMLVLRLTLRGVVLALRLALRNPSLQIEQFEARVRFANKFSMSAMRWIRSEKARFELEERVNLFEDALRHRNEAMCEMEIYSNYN